MLDAHAVIFPEAVSVFSLLYGVDAPVIMLDDDLKETVIWSEEGPVKVVLRVLICFVQGLRHWSARCSRAILIFTSLF